MTTTTTRGGGWQVCWPFVLRESGASSLDYDNDDDYDNEGRMVGTLLTRRLSLVGRESDYDNDYDNDNEGECDGVVGGEDTPAGAPVRGARRAAPPLTLDEHT